MAPPEPQRPALFTAILNGHRLVTLACMVTLSVAAWWWLWQGAVPMPGPSMPGMAMPGMAMAPAPLVWSGTYLASTFAMWTIMMVAMMLPSAAPMILLHEVFSRKRGLGLTATLAFALSYLALWAGFALLAALAQAGLIRSGAVDAMSLALGNRRLAALLLLAAAAYELSPLKRLCLAHCQSPVMFLSRHWRGGTGGAIRMGVTHALFCIGCCWVLMLLLFVGGVMNLAWIAVLSVVVLLEKYAPPRWRADRWLAGMLLAAAIAILVVHRS